MSFQIGVVGGSGYTGAELLRLLHAHPEAEVVLATGDSNAGARVASLYPSLAAAYPDLAYTPVDPAAMAGLNLVFVALPHGASQQVIPALVEAVPHVVDLGADFRLAPAVYEQWYGEEHVAPELQAQFAFGLPEVFRADVLAKAHVAAPGCYPTVSSLTLAPLLADGLVAREGILVDAMSGVSGAGRGAKVTSLFSEVDETIATYGLLTHRHTAEMEHVLGHVAGAPVQVLFTPHLAPMIRGIHATTHATPIVDGLSTESLLVRYREYYADEPFVVITDEPPTTKACAGANTVQITVRYDARTNRVLALGVMDNLVKGASGQAIQNANLLLGIPETTGLPVTGLMP